MRLSDGLIIHRSLLGSTLTILLFAILCTYALYEFISMHEYNATNIQISTQELYFEDSRSFKRSSDNFNVAFALVIYESETDSDYSRYGRVKATMKEWGNNSIGFREIATHPCTAEELGLS